MDVGSNASQPNGDPGTGALLDFRAAGQEQRLNISPSYARLSGTPENER